MMDTQASDFIVAEVVRRAISEPETPLPVLFLDAIEDALILYGEVAFGEP